MSRYLIRSGVVVAALALIFAAVASGEWKEYRVGNLVLADGGGISPSKLPKHGFAPVKAQIVGKISTLDGSHPAALRQVEVEVDKTIKIDAAGIPTCSLGQLTSRSSSDAKRACPDAIVGSGSAEVEVAFPEQAPFSSTGPLLLFNGGVHGRATTVYLHAYVNVPAPTAIVTTAKITHISRGRFGSLIDVRIPRIAGGAGSPTKFDVRIGRKFTYKGQKKSFLVAGCPTGSWATKGRAEFDDGTKMGLTHLFPCTPQG